MPAELLVDLANRLDADPWFCVPHKADDVYVAELAAVVAKSLSPKRKAYVEYSNEVWNGQFKQHKYAGEQGIKLGFAKPAEPWAGAWRYTARRSKEIFAVWEKAFGGRDRLVRVLPSQSVNPYVSEQILKHEGAAKAADVLAIAPYFGPSPGPNGKPAAGEVAGWTVDQLLDHVEGVELPKAVKAIRDSKAVADKYGVKLVAYEAGQHLVGIQGAENDAKLTKLLHAANAHPRIGAVYDKYLAAWAAEGGDLLCHFSSVGEWSKWGSWGLLQHADSPPAGSPKFVSVMTWAKAQGQPVRVP